MVWRVARGGEAGVEVRVEARVEARVSNLNLTRLRSGEVVRDLSRVAG